MIVVLSRGHRPSLSNTSSRSGAPYSVRIRTAIARETLDKRAGPGRDQPLHLEVLPSVSCLFKWRHSNRRSSCWRLAGTCASLCPTATWKNSLPSADFRSTTSPSGGGCSVTPQKFSADCDRGSDRPTTVGGWMRPTSGLRASGCIYTGLSTPSGAAGHQHRRARRLSTGHRAAQSRGGSAGELPASTGAISQRSGTGSSGDQAPDTRKPAFSFVLGSLAHIRPSPR